MRIGRHSAKIFKIKNRQGFAAVCENHLTEGETIAQACSRMTKALRRSAKKRK